MPTSARAGSRDGVGMGIFGVVLLFGVDLSGDVTALAGGLMVLLASLGYAVGALFLEHRLRGVPARGSPPSCGCRSGRGRSPRHEDDGDSTLVRIGASVIWRVAP